MNRKVRLTKEADRHLTEAASRYERQRVGLGREFPDEALSAFPLLAEPPSKYPSWTLADVTTRGKRTHK